MVKPMLFIRSKIKREFIVPTKENVIQSGLVADDLLDPLQVAD